MHIDWLVGEKLLGFLSCLVGLLVCDACITTAVHLHTESSCFHCAFLDTFGHKTRAITLAPCRDVRSSD